MRYIIRQSFCEEESYYASFSGGVADFDTSLEKAHSFSKRDDAERAIVRILKVLPNLGILEVLPIGADSKVCKMDCFHCPFPDCRNGKAAMTEWERSAIRCAKIDV